MASPSWYTFVYMFFNTAAVHSLLELSIDCDIGKSMLREQHALM